MTALSPPTLLQSPYLKVCGFDIMKRINTSKTTEPDYVDLRNIKEALFFLAPLFHGSIQFEKDIWSVIAKTQRLLKESSPVAE